MSESTASIVAFFSGTGFTEQAARYISDLTGAEFYPIEPVQPYTSEDLDYDNPDSRVMIEHDNPSKQNVLLSNQNVPGWDNFDVVYLGYPIWWYKAAWPIDNFVKDNDFSGKTVYPFCTSFESPAGESGELLAAMAKTGNWEPAERFPEDVSEHSVKHWLKKIHQI